jgi:hypothetical protein
MDIFLSETAQLAHVVLLPSRTRRKTAFTGRLAHSGAQSSSPR